MACTAFRSHNRLHSEVDGQIRNAVYCHRQTADYSKALQTFIQHIMEVESYRGKSVLVTGGLGFLGASLVAMLSNVDCRIIRVLRRGTNCSPIANRAKIIDVIGDIREAAVWLRALEDVDIVIHLAGQTSVQVANEDPVADFDANVLPMLQLLETCRCKGHRPIVLFSGTVTQAGMPSCLPVDERHPDMPTTVYDVHKQMAENYLKYYVNQGTVCGATLRLANVYGPGPQSSNSERGVLNRMIRRALRGEALTVYGKGDVLRDYVYVEDAARAFLLAGVSIGCTNGQHYVIGEGHGHTLEEAFNTVAARVALKTGRKVQVTHTHPPGPPLPIESRSFVADSSRFCDATGWRTEIPFAAGIDRTIEAYLCAL